MLFSASIVSPPVYYKITMASYYDILYFYIKFYIVSVP